VKTTRSRTLNRFVGWAFVYWGLSAVALVGAAEAPVPARVATLAARSLLTALAVSPSGQLLAVGERGHILLSRDGGAHWRQSSVPVDALLTAACFVDDQVGYVVGHDETILATADGGSHWRIAHFAPDAAQPFLSVACDPSGDVIAVGAYATLARSTDHGQTFAITELSAAPLKEKKRPARMDDDADLEQPHLNAIASSSDGTVYIAGEAGHLYRSDDHGHQWVALPSPYAGSFFAVQPIGEAGVLVAGLRGHLFRSADRGQHWVEIRSGVDALLDGSTILPDGRVVIVGLAGVVLTSSDGAQTFSSSRMADRKGLAAVVAGPEGPIIVGENGVRRLSLKSRE